MNIYILERMAQKFPPQEVLGDFIMIKEATSENVRTLQNYLCQYEPNRRKEIINAQLPRYHKRTSVHLAADKGRSPFLDILLKNEGEF